MKQAAVTDPLAKHVVRNHSQHNCYEDVVDALKLRYNQNKIMYVKEHLNVPTVSDTY